MARGAALLTLLLLAASAISQVPVNPMPYGIISPVTPSATPGRTVGPPTRAPSFCRHIGHWNGHSGRSECYFSTCMAQYTTPVTIPYKSRSVDADGITHTTQTSTVVTGPRWGNAAPQNHMHINDAGAVQLDDPPYRECNNHTTCEARCMRMVKRGEIVAWGSIGILLVIGGIAIVGIVWSLTRQKKKPEDEKREELIEETRVIAAEEGRRVVSTGSAPKEAGPITRRERSGVDFVETV